MTDDKDIAKVLSDKDLTKKEYWKKVKEFGLKPGQLIPGTTQWIPWRVEDLDPKDTVQFVPQYVASIGYNGVISSRGNPVLMVDVNNLKALYEVGVLTTTNRFFYNAYVNALDNAIALEEFKRSGPKDSPWAFGYEDGRTGWHYIPMAPSFGMDINGRYLRNAEWYELDEDNIPVAIKDTKLLAKLYFDGALDFNITRKQFAELVWMLWMAKIKGKINRFMNKFKRGTNGNKR